MKLLWKIFLLVLFISAIEVHAQNLYHWVDEKGVIHFTNNPHSIPVQFRGKAQKGDFSSLTRESLGTKSKILSESQHLTPRFQVPFVRQGKDIVIRGTVNGKEQYTVEFIMDTEATLSFIPRAMALKLGIDPASGDPFPLSSNGIGLIVPLVEIQSLKVGKAEVKNLAVAIHDIGGKGILGLDFLSNFRVNINDSQNQVVLEPKTGADALLLWRDSRGE